MQKPSALQFQFSPLFWIDTFRRSAGSVTHP
jgi:hypothetical protein